MISYELHLLGWHSFQQLSQSILREILGQTVQSFLDTKDGGRDGAFSGTWIQAGGENFEGEFVFQCKFTSKQGEILKNSTLKNELSKAKRLVDLKRCDTYILITNCYQTGVQDEAIGSEFKKIGIKHFAIFGYTWICQQIQQSKNLRMMVPRLYGLGDLSQIIDRRAYAQANELLKSISDDLAKIVVTESYRKAAKALEDHGFVLLIGEPAAGKTTIASLLAMGALDKWGLSTLKLEKAEAVKKHWNAEDPRQFFWVDDAFGATQYEAHFVQAWNHIFPDVKAMIKQKIKIVLTSRDYIYNRARKELKVSAFPIMNESQVVIDVHNLSLIEKKQILYNHIKLGTQDKEFKKKIKPFLGEIASLEKFYPETARRLGDSMYTRNLQFSKTYLVEFVNEQSEFLKEVLTGLDRHCWAALALIYMRNNSLESPITLQDSEESAIHSLESNLGECITALDAMKNSFVQIFYEESATIWSFKHPTIADAYASLLSASPEHLGIYLVGIKVSEMVNQITCGNIGFENTVIISNKLFPIVYGKLKQLELSLESNLFTSETWNNRKTLYEFLSSRCSKDFLDYFIQHSPSTLQKIANPGLYLDSVPEVKLACKLYEVGLLEESVRSKFVGMVISYAVNGRDFYVLKNEQLKNVLTEIELKELKAKIEIDIPDKLESIRHTLENEFYKSDWDAESYMDDHIDNLKLLRSQFPQNEMFNLVIDAEIEESTEWIAKNTIDFDDDIPREKQILRDVENDSTDQRDIFDDIDQD